MNSASREEIDYAAVDAVLDAVGEDVAEAMKLLDGADNAHNRRSYVRAAFAAIEAVIFWIKYRELRSYERSGGDRILTPGELSLLREETYTLNHAGQVHVQQRFVPLDQNIRFIVKVCFHEEDVVQRIDFGGSDWANFREAMRMRNRLAHPKRSHEMDVSDSELVVMKRAYGWVWATMLRLFSDSVERLRTQAAALSSQQKDGSPA